MTEYQWRTCRRVDRMLHWLLEPGEPIRTRWQGLMPTRAQRISKRKMQLFACALRRRHASAASLPGWFTAVEDWVETQGSPADLHRSAGMLSLQVDFFLTLLQDLDWTHPDAIETLRTRVGLFHGFEADLLRELLGTPHRPLILTAEQRAWNDGTLATLARSIAQTRDFAQMPILGDALEDAGCTDEEALAHCRASESHVLGCWVLDACQGRS
jgi:hypothetical protein